MSASRLAFRLGVGLSACTLALALSGGLLGILARSFPGLDPERVRLSPETICQPPGRLPHLLGTDDQGRDCLLRLAAGAARTLPAALGAVAVALSVGVPVGFAAGFFGGAWDHVLMRMSAVWMAMPPLVLAIAIVAALGPSLVNVCLAVGFTQAPGFARMVRARVLVEARRDYVLAARAIGMRPLRICASEVWPNVLVPLVAFASLAAGGSILEIAGLGFLGLGVEPGTPEWGTDVAANRSSFLSAPWTILVPGLATSLAVLGFNLLGDSLQKRVTHA